MWELFLFHFEILYRWQCMTKDGSLRRERGGGSLQSSFFFNNLVFKNMIALCCEMTPIPLILVNNIIDVFQTKLK